MCRTPPYFENSTTFVSFAIQVTKPAPAIIRSSGNITFKYVRHPVVDYAYHLSGPYSGYSVVELTGSFENTVGGLMCKFGDVVVNATYVSPVSIRCASPPVKMLAASVSVVPLSIAQSSQDFINTGYMFTYYPNSVVNAILPSSGPISGNIEVRLFGSFPIPTGQSVCIFGGVNSTIVSEEEGVITCLLPATPLSGDVAISLSFNGLDIEPTNLSFYYYSRPGLLSMYPTLGTLKGTTPITITAANIMKSADWFCAFGDTAIRATYVNNTQLTCLSTPSLSQVAGIVNVTLLLLTDTAVDVISVTDFVLQRATIAEGILQFKYVIPVKLVTISPAIVFIDSGYTVNITGSNLLVSSTISCEWRITNSTPISTVATPANCGSLDSIEINTNELLVYDCVKCAAPHVSAPCTAAVAISVNGFVETDSSLSLQLISPPKITSVLPSRFVSGQSASVLISGSNFFKNSVNQLCAYYGGNETFGNVSATIISDTLASCEVPANLPVRRQVQLIKAVGPKPVSEVQCLEISALPNQQEVQIIKSSAWGLSNAVWELRAGRKSVSRVISKSSNIYFVIIGVALSSANRPVYQFQVALSGKSTVQRVVIKPAAYMQELQHISISSTVTNMLESYRPYRDTGVIFLATGLWNGTVYWNATSSQLQDVLSTIPNVQNVTVSKTLQQHPNSFPNYTDVRISWNITYGIADGDALQVSISGYSIPRALVFESSVSTQTQGIACEVQEVKVVGATGGSFSLLYGSYVTSPIPFDASEELFKQTLLSAFISVPDLYIERIIVSESVLKWLIYFTENPGKLSLLKAVNIDLSPAGISTGSFSAFVTASEIVEGQGRKLTGSIFLSSATIPINTSPSAVYSFIPTSISSSSGSYVSSEIIDWVITFDPNAGLVPPLTVDSSQLLGAYVHVSVSTVVAGYAVSAAVPPPSGLLTIKSVRVATSSGNGSNSISIPFSSTTSVWQDALKTIGLGDVSVAKTVTTTAHTWTVTFSELLRFNSSTLTMDTSQVVSNLVVKPSVVASKTPTVSCCLVGGEFVLSLGNSTSPTLNRNSTVSDISKALLSIKAITSPEDVQVVAVNRPGGGVSWLIECLNKIPLNKIAIRVIKPLVLASSSAQTVVQMQNIRKELRPERQRVLIHSSSDIFGTFKLSYMGIHTRTMSIDITARRLEDEISSSFGFESVTISPVAYTTAPGLSGGFRSWDIDFTSVAGPLALLGCDASGVMQANTNDLQCTVRKIVNATSQHLSGGFTIIGSNGLVSSLLPHNATVTQIASAISSVYTSMTVEVSSASTEPDGSFSWAVTFPVNQGSLPLLRVDGSGLRGTGAKINVHREQAGNYLSGSFSLGFGTEATAVLGYNATELQVKNSLESLDSISSVTVSKKIFGSSRKYLITFVLPRGDVKLLDVRTASLAGSGVTISTYEVLKGVDEINGMLSLSYNENKSEAIDIRSSTAADMEKALSAIENIGDLVVSKSTSSSSGGSVNIVEWLVTFTTLGFPPNSGTTPLLAVASAIPMDGKIDFSISYSQTACCNLLLSFNGGYELSSSSIPISIDSQPMVFSVAPQVGLESGRTSVNVIGSGFMAISEQSVYCLFGSVKAIATIINSTFAQCIAPPQPAGKVMVGMQLFAFDNKTSRFAGSSSTFVYEQALQLLSLNPDVGQVDEITEVMVQSSLLGTSTAVNKLSCLWTLSISSPSMNIMLPHEIATLAINLNGSQCTCPTPLIADYFIGKIDNYDWRYSTNITAELSLTKNFQEFSNTLKFVFFPKPVVYSISPEVVSPLGSVQVAVNGSNFVSTKYAKCKIGTQVSPLTVTSSQSAICSTMPSSVQSTVHQLRILGPKIHVEQQRIEVWLVHQPLRKVNTPSGAITISIEGEQTSAVPISLLPINAYILAQTIGNISRIGTVSVTEHQRIINGGVDNSIQWRVATLDITFVSREDDVQQLLVDYSSIHGFQNDDKIIVSTIINGGCKILSPEIHTWGFANTVSLTSISKGYNLIWKFNTTYAIASFTFRDNLKTIQVKINNALLPFRDNKVVVVDTLSQSPFVMQWSLLYPVSMGSVAVPVLDVSPLPNSALLTLSYYVNTIRNGSYIPLGGSFTLSFDNVSTASIPYNADENIVRNSLEDITEMPGVAVTRYSSDDFNGYFWNVTFNSYVGNNFDGVIDFQVNTDGISGTNVTGTLQELQTGQGTKLPVEVSFDGVHYSANRVVLEWLQPLQVIKIHPNTGPRSGNTLITVHIARIHRTLREYGIYNIQCLFNATEMPARVVSNSSVECLTPPNAYFDSSYVIVSLTLNGQEIAESSSTFTFEQLPSVSSLSISPSFGTVLGGTLVTISWNAIVQSGNAFCSFDDIIVPVKDSANGYLTCLSPRVSSTRQSTVSYTLNGQNFVQNTFLTFDYYDPPIISSISPSSGSIYGNSSISIIGQNFNPSSGTFYCRFGDQVVTAIRNSDTKLTCLAPEVKPVYEVHSVEFSLPPFAPAAQRIIAELKPPQTDQFNVTVQANPATPSVMLFNFNVSDQNAVQEIKISLDTALPPVAVLTIKDRGFQQEVQTIETYADEHPAIQAVLLRAPYNSYQQNYSSIQQIVISNPNAKVVLMIGEQNYVTFSGTFSALDLQVLMNKHTYGQGCNVTKVLSNSLSYFTITFNSSLDVVPRIEANASSGSINVYEISKGGLCEIQQIVLTYSNAFAEGYLRIGLNGEYTDNIPFNVSKASLKNFLEDNSQIGKVSVTVDFVKLTLPNSNVITVQYIWTISFLQKLGNLPMLNLRDFLGANGDVAINEIRSGTTFPIEGAFALSVEGFLTIPIPVSASGSEVADAINSLQNSYQSTVTRYDLLNNGVMFLVQFANIGPISPITIDATNLTATAIDASVSIYQTGEIVGGAFIIDYTNSSGAYSSDPINYDASEMEVRDALEKLNSNFNPLQVSRRSNNIFSTYTWYVTFPASLGHVAAFDTNAAGLSGPRAGARALIIQDGLIPNVQKISTTSTSPLKGYFTLTLESFSTGPISYNASAEELQQALEILPNVGPTLVTRVSTGFLDTSTWGDGAVGALAEELHLVTVAPLFEYDLFSYDWTITFLSRSGPMALLTACCDELHTEDFVNVTLTSQWSRDSAISVSSIHQGNMQGLNGQIALTVAGTTTAVFPIDAAATVIARELASIGYPVNITQVSTDANGLSSWLLNFNSEPFLDVSTALSLSVDTSSLYPIASREFVSFNWYEQPPQHAVMWFYIKNVSSPSILVLRVSNTSFNSSMISLNNMTTASPFISLPVYLPSNAGADSIAQAIVANYSMFGSVSVTMEYIADSTIASAMNVSLSASAYKITFLYSSTYYFNSSCNNCALYVSQQSSIKPLDGTFNLRMSADSALHAEVPYNVSATNLTSIIDTLLGYNNSVEVSENSTFSFMRTWLVTFSGDFVGGDIPLMSIDTTNLNGTFPQGQVNTVVYGSEVTGNVSLTANFSNVLIDVRSDPISVARLCASLNPNIYDVSVDIYGPTFSGDLQWTISYLSYGDVSITFNSSMLSGPSLIATMTYLIIGSPPLSGYFSVTGTAQIALQTVPIEVSLPYNASADVFAEMLIDQGIPATVLQQVMMKLIL